VAPSTHLLLHLLISYCSLCQLGLQILDLRSEESESDTFVKCGRDAWKRDWTGSRVLSRVWECDEYKLQQVLAFGRTCGPCMQASSVHASQL
jgi:hypothetical protein